MNGVFKSQNDRQKFGLLQLSIRPTFSVNTAMICINHKYKCKPRNGIKNQRILNSQMNLKPANEAGGCLRRALVTPQAGCSEPLIYCTT